MNFVEEGSYHLPILTKEVVEFLGCKSGGIYVDCTLGGGGHSTAILEASSPEGRLIGIDRDGDAISEAGHRLEKFGKRKTLVRGDYRDIKTILGSLGVEGVDGIIADLGVSSWQLNSPERGFSFMREGPLDMRMDRDSELTAATLIEETGEKELSRIIKEYGEERFAGPIARAIKKAGQIETTGKLAAIVADAVPRKAHPQKIHVATRTFQALRIAVNSELEGLDTFISNAVGLLAEKGRLAVITFHSLEDRIVKHRFRSLATGCICPPDIPVCACGKKAGATLVTKKGIKPGEEEIRINPRARSATLRILEKN